jgi:hypothetical protein
LGRGVFWKLVFDVNLKEKKKIWKCVRDEKITFFEEEKGVYYA